MALTAAKFTDVRVLVPGTGPHFRCGGLSVAKQTVRLLEELIPTTLVTYRERSIHCQLSLIHI